VVKASVLYTEDREFNSHLLYHTPVAQRKSDGLLIRRSLVQIQSGVRRDAII
jgi:hypothetical protein